MEHDEAARYQTLVDAIRSEFSYDFVGLAPVPDTDQPELTWKYASGNWNNRFRRIVLPPGIGVMGIVYGSKRPLIVEDVARDIPRKDQYQYPIVAAEGLESFFALPLMEGDVLRAVLLCAYRESHAIDRQMLADTARAVVGASSCTVPLDHAIRPAPGAQDAVYEDMTHKVLQAQEEERKRIARELHDGISQEILLAQIELRKIKYLDPEKKDEGIERASDYLRQIMKHVNDMATGLRPALLDEMGLGSAIASYCDLLQDAYGVTISTNAEATVKLDEDRETALYRIFQEAVMNACKYSRTESIDVALQREGDMVVLAIRDYGIGFDISRPTVRGGGLGLGGMKERADLIGGDLAITSSANEGTLVRVALPEERG